ncbi:MAG: aspartate-semialdehyde dehydrogenase, partial [Cyanobacteria bacterium P01_A01_bin.116]
MSDAYNVAIMGATGAVGTELLQLLDERNFPIKSLKLLASPRSAGKEISFKGSAIAVEPVSAEAFQGVDIVLASAGGSTSKQWAKAIVDAGALMI